jgi:protocatechuate 3,4-dioxygenase alpha subunit
VRKPERKPGEAPHLNLTVHARGLLRHLVTRVYFADEEAANAADPVLQKVEPARRPTLIARQEGGVFRFDVRLQGEGETVFFDSAAR